MTDQALAEAGARPELKGLGDRAVEELRAGVQQALSQPFSRFLAQATDALKREMAEAMNSGAQRGYQELISSLEGDRRAWSDAFLSQVQKRLVGGISPKAANRMAAGNAESIPMAKALLRAEKDFSKPITEIDARLNRLRLMLDLKLHSKALAPTGLHLSMDEAADQMGCPGIGRSALFDAYREHFIEKLESIYETLLKEIRTIGAHAADALKTLESPEELEIPVPLEPRPQGRLHPPSNLKLVDPATSRMLKKFALAPDGEGYTDGLLAADLLALMDNQPLSGLSAAKQNIPLERLSLAGHFLNEVSSDPLVPSALRPEHESIRMPLLKSAIADASLFTAEVHPLRSLIEELVLCAATLRLADNPETRRMSELLAEVLEHFDLAPDFVREAMNNAEPIEKSQIDRFFALQRRQAEQRKAFVINEAKRMVAEEIERSSFGRDVTEAGKKFLDKVWAPYMTRCVIRFGASHENWKNAIVSADQLIDQLELREPSEKPSEDWVGLVRKMCEELVEAGLPADQKMRLMHLLESARKTPKAA